MNRYDIALGKKPPPPPPHLIEITDETRPIYKNIFDSVKSLYALDEVSAQAVDRIADIGVADNYRSMVRTISRERMYDPDSIVRRRSWEVGFGDRPLEHIRGRRMMTRRRIGISQAVSMVDLQRNENIVETVREYMRQALLEQGAIPESIEYRYEADIMNYRSHITAEGYYYEA